LWNIFGEIATGAKKNPTTHACNKFSYLKLGYFTGTEQRQQQDGRSQEQPKNWKRFTPVFYHLQKICNAICNTSATSILRHNGKQKPQ